MRVGERPPTAIQREDGDDLRDLASRAGGGDTEAFRRLFDRYHDRLYRYAYVRVGGREEAQDVLQEVFLAVWRGLPSFRHDHEGSFPAWLFGIARNVVGTHRRRKGRSVPLDLEALPDRPVEFEGVVVSRRMVVEELARLPEAQREVLVLRFLVGLSGREVANAIGRSEGAVTALQVRALRRLRAGMEEISR